MRTPTLNFFISIYKINFIFKGKNVDAENFI